MSCSHSHCCVPCCSVLQLRATPVQQEHARASPPLKSPCPCAASLAPLALLSADRNASGARLGWRVGWRECVTPTMDAAPAPPPASGGVGGEPVDEAKAQSREDSLRHVATEVGAYAVAQPLQTTDAPPQAASDGAPLQRSLSRTASGSVAVASKLCVAPSLAQATPDSSRARGRVPHPDSLREKRTQRGGREFTYVPPDHMREGGDANKPVEVRARYAAHQGLNSRAPSPRALVRRCACEQLSCRCATST